MKVYFTFPDKKALSVTWMKHESLNPRDPKPSIPLCALVVACAYRLLFRFPDAPRPPPVIGKLFCLRTASCTEFSCPSYSFKDHI